MAFGECPSGLSICILKNTYEPTTWVGGSVTPGVEAMVKVIRRVIGSASAAPNQEGSNLATGSISDQPGPQL